MQAFIRDRRFTLDKLMFEYHACTGNTHTVQSMHAGIQYASVVDITPKQIMKENNVGISCGYYSRAAHYTVTV